MNVCGDNWSIVYENSVIRMSGRFSLMRDYYNDIEKFFEKILESAPTEITLDIRNLEFLNSAGIAVLCMSLILELAAGENTALSILCSDRYTWQRETVPTFKGLLNDMNIIFEQNYESA